MSKILLRLPPGMNESLKSMAAQRTVDEGTYVSKHTLIIRALQSMLDKAPDCGAYDILRVHLTPGLMESYAALALTRGETLGNTVSHTLVKAVAALNNKETNWSSLVDYASRRGWTGCCTTGKVDTRIRLPQYRGSEVRAAAETYSASVSDTAELLLIYAPALGLFAPREK